MAGGAPDGDSVRPGQALGVIPARYGATRFPGKPLATLCGKPMIQCVYERAKQATLLDRIIIATDDERIAAAVRQCGGEAVMTPSALPSGTDRVAAVARDLAFEVIVNIQGDEPLMEPAMIDQVVQALTDDPQLPIATLCKRLTAAEDIANPNVVKVARDARDRALYFSRSPIPFKRGTVQPTYWKHLGIYGYRKASLLQFVACPPTPLEQAEQLEQLRALEHGMRIGVFETAHDTIAVDTPEDLRKVEERLQHV